MLSDSTCFFSGYRPEKLPDGGRPNSPRIQAIKARLEHTLRDACQCGYQNFICGMSRGFDTWAAETVCRLQEEYPIRLICALPFDGQERLWSREDQDRYYDLLKRSWRTFCLNPDFTRDAYRRRNCFMADHSSLLICYYDGQPGGTAYTVQYARKHGKTIINLGDPQLSLFE